MRNYILAGHLNSGKSAIVLKILNHLGWNMVPGSSVSDHREITDVFIRAGSDILRPYIQYEDDELAIDDIPDMAESLIRFSFGRSGQKDGLTLFDTPGPAADSRALENTARVALGLPQVGEAEDEIANISVLTLGRPDDRGISDFEHNKSVPINNIDAYLNREELGCIYVLSASETSFLKEEKEKIRGHIAALREIYKDRFFIVVTHQDILETWPKRQQEQRKEMLKDITGGQYTWVNGKTGDGIEDLITTLSDPRLQRSEFQTLCTTVENIILSYADRDEIDPFLNIEEIAEFSSGVFHRLNRPIYAIMAGRTNSGKTSVIKQVFSDVAAEIRYGDEVLKIDDAPDVTKSLIRLPFGRSGQKDGLALFDTPGLTADRRALENTARVALGLPQRGEPEDEIANISVLTLGRPDENDIADVKSDDDFPIDAVDAYLNREKLNCIYVLKGAETPWEKENIKDQIAALREIYKDRFFIVVTHQDILKTWPKETKDERYKSIKEVTGGQYTWLNGKTGDGLEAFSLEFLIKGNNYSAREFEKHMRVEYRGARLFHASHQLSDILMAIFFSKRLQEQPDELLYPGLQLLVELAIESIYGTPDPEWQEGSEESVIESAKQIVEASVKTHQHSKEQERDTKGIREWFKAFLTTWKPTEIVTVTETVIEAPVTVLSYLYYILYCQIYSRETASETSTYDPATGSLVPQSAVTPITTEVVGEETAINWFTAELAPYKNLIENRENAWDFYRIVTPVLARFWQAHHPEVLPIDGSSNPSDSQTPA